MTTHRKRPFTGVLPPSQSERDGTTVGSDEFYATPLMEHLANSIADDRPSVFAVCGVG